ncbi:MAG: 6-carboxytetrahydropterin synthase [Bacteroidetes bacterium]|nr:6-carboxytetrahydropterin synthase [Bacteroidota bacterium]MBK8342677.1 6-carboxytetrahydropterin synthase [Bacteroidota bacterium]MBK8343266.1 6-carboxytetrahydropterin synthase [Bacteroidota bacterium]
MRTTVCRRATFNAAHRLFNPDWDDATNDRVFGLCNNPNYHGHNYTLIVKITGDIQPDTGYVMDLKIVNELIKDLVIEPFDHNNLNLDVPEFKMLNPTAENIAKVIYDKFRAKLNSNLDVKIQLYETENNFVEYPG